MLEADNQETTKSNPPIRVVLSDIKATRRTYSRFIRAYERGQITTEKAKTLTYMFNTYCQMFKIEADLSIQDRITAIEKALNVSNK